MFKHSPTIPNILDCQPLTSCCPCRTIHMCVRLGMDFRAPLGKPTIINGKRRLSKLTTRIHVLELPSPQDWLFQTVQRTHHKKKIPTLIILAPLSLFHFLVHCISPYFLQIKFLSGLLWQFSTLLD